VARQEGAQQALRSQSGLQGSKCTPVRQETLATVAECFTGYAEYFHIFDNFSDNFDLHFGLPVKN